MFDGSEISAIAANEHSIAQAIRSKNLYLTFEGRATINGDIMADVGMMLDNGYNVVVNGNIEGSHLFTESTIGTVSGKMKFGCRPEHYRISGFARNRYVGPGFGVY